MALEKNPKFNALQRNLDNQEKAPINETWMVLYIERWLKAPVMMPDGKVHDRDHGTPQGGVASPLLANLFLHYTFDKWMGRNYPDIPFERYADDAVCHCRTKRQANHLKDALERRFEDCGLTLHPQKTRIVYCKDSDRQRSYPDTSFDFLGYTFRPRRSKNRWGKFFVNFSPAISNKAAKAIRREIRSWKLQLRSDKSLDDLARMFNATIRGWMNRAYPVVTHTHYMYGVATSGSGGGRSGDGCFAAARPFVWGLHT